MNMTSLIADALLTPSVRKLWVGTILAACTSALVLSAAAGGAQAEVTRSSDGRWVCGGFGGICHCRMGSDKCAAGCAGTMSCERGTCSCTGGLNSQATTPNKSGTPVKGGKILTTTPNTTLPLKPGG